MAIAIMSPNSRIRRTKRRTCGSWNEKPGHDIFQPVKCLGDVKAPPVLAGGRAPRAITSCSGARLTGHGLYTPHPYRRFRQCNYIMSRFSGGRLKDIRSDVLERLAPIFEQSLSQNKHCLRKYVFASYCLGEDGLIHADRRTNPGSTCTRRGYADRREDRKICDHWRRRRQGVAGPADASFASG